MKIKGYKYSPKLPLRLDVSDCEAELRDNSGEVIGHLTSTGVGEYIVGVVNDNEELYQKLNKTQTDKVLLCSFVDAIHQGYQMENLPEVARQLLVDIGYLYDNKRGRR